MALEANFHCAIGAEARRIDDGLADFFERRSRCLRRCEMRRAWTVAALAINTFGNAAENRFHYGLPAVRRDFRDAVVAEHALVGDGSTEGGMIRAVVARVHGPIAAVLGVPGERQFHERIAAGAVQIRAHVIARADHKVDFLFEDVGLLAVETDLVTALIEAAIALE